jgi:hypothetical protein
MVNYWSRFEAASESSRADSSETTKRSRFLSAVARATWSVRTRLLRRGRPGGLRCHSMNLKRRVISTLAKDAIQRRLDVDVARMTEVRDAIAECGRVALLPAEVGSNDTQSEALHTPRLTIASSRATSPVSVSSRQRGLLSTPDRIQLSDHSSAPPLRENWSESCRNRTGD